MSENREISLDKTEAAAYLNLSESAFEHHVRRSKRIPPAAVVGKFGKKFWTKDQLDEFHKYPVRRGWQERPDAAELKLTPAQFLDGGYNDLIAAGKARAFHKPHQFRKEEKEIERIEEREGGYSRVFYKKGNGRSARIWRSARVRVELIESEG